MAYQYIDVLREINVKRAGSQCDVGTLPFTSLIALTESGGANCFLHSLARTRPAAASIEDDTSI